MSLRAFVVHLYVCRVTVDGQDNSTSGGVRVWWAIVSVGLTAAAIVLAVQKVETYDSYCGSVLYDTQMMSPCGDQMWWRRTAVAVLSVLAVGALVLAVSLGRETRQLRFSMVLAFSLAVVFIGVLIAANRFLQPAEDWCGSVMNRHRTYEPIREAHCDDRLRPHLVFGVFWMWIALCGLAAAVWAALGLRSTKD